MTSGSNPTATKERVPAGTYLRKPSLLAYYGFGGWRNSLFGDTHAQGTGGVHFFTRGKVVTTRWLNPRHAGVNPGSPQNS